MHRKHVSWAVIASLTVTVGLGVALLSRAHEAPATDKQAAAPKIAKSKIDRVTVYPNSALVTREVEVPDGAGLIELVITPTMPDQIVPSTMYSEGGTRCVLTAKDEPALNRMPASA